MNRASVSFNWMAQRVCSRNQLYTRTNKPHISVQRVQDPTTLV